MCWIIRKGREEELKKAFYYSSNRSTKCSIGLSVLRNFWSEKVTRHPFSRYAKGYFFHSRYMKWVAFCQKWYTKG